MFRFKMLSDCVRRYGNRESEKESLPSTCTAQDIQRSTTGKSDQKRQLAYLWFVCSIDNNNKNTSAQHRFGKLCVNVVMAYECVCVCLSHPSVRIRCNEICGHVACSLFLVFAFYFILNDIWIIFCGHRLCAKLKEQTIWEQNMAGAFYAKRHSSIEDAHAFQFRKDSARSR